MPDWNAYNKIQNKNFQQKNGFGFNIQKNSENIFKDVVKDTNKIEKIENEEAYENITKSVEDKLKIKFLNSVATKLQEEELKCENINHNETQYMKINYQKELNEQQYNAVKNIDGPLLVIAGAGSGKTKTLTHRVAYMIEQGIDPEQILLLTFTKKAAKEMLNRVSSLLQNKKVKKIQGGTFHSFAFGKLKKYSPLLKYSDKLTVIDEEDCSKILKLIIKESFADDNTKENIKDLNINPEYLLKIQTTCINNLLTIEEYVNKMPENKGSDIIQYALNTYKEYKNKHEMLDFDDILYYFYQHLQNNSDFKNKILDEISYIMVDEYQDTNLLQISLLKALSSKCKNIMVVGDDSQSIYAFRNAKVENILLFKEQYPESKFIKLEKNYRSNQPILDFANNILKNAEIGYKKTLMSNKNSFNKPTMKRFDNAFQEADYILLEIENKIKNFNINPQDICILYNKSALANIVRGKLIAKKIPYIQYGGMKFARTKIAKFFYSLAGTLCSEFNPIFWIRVCENLDKIGVKALEEITVNIKENEGLKLDKISDRKKWKKNLADFYKNMENIQTAQNIEKQKTMFLQYGVQILQDADNFSESDEEYLEIVKSTLDNSENIVDFYSAFNLLEEEAEKDSSNKICLSTIHSAKGLEWEYVYIIGMLEYNFPGKNIKNFEELEEKRRLFYVACTRAKQRLTLTIPSKGKSVSPQNAISRFLLEIPKEFYQED